MFRLAGWLAVSLAMASLGQQAAAQTGRQVIVYEVVLTGATFDAYPFQRIGYLGLRQPIDRRNVSGNGVNLRDVILVSGNPTTAPDRGAIWYMSNRAMGRLMGDAFAQSQLDGAWVWGNNQGEGFVRVDQNLAAAMSLNNFNAQSGPLADVYLIKSGGMNLRFRNNRVEGLVEFYGTGYIFAGNVHYAAYLTGRRVMTLSL